MEKCIIWHSGSGSECHISLTSPAYGKLIVRNISSFPGTWTAKSKSDTQIFLAVLRKIIILVAFHLTCYSSYSTSIKNYNFLKLPMKVRKIMPSVAQQDTWCSRVTIPDAGDLFKLLLLPCSDALTEYPEHNSCLFGEGTVSVVSNNSSINIHWDGEGGKCMDGRIFISHHLGCKEKLNLENIPENS